MADESKIGLPINSVIPLNNSNNVSNKNSQTWLKTGQTSTDFATYPDARVTVEVGNATLSGTWSDTWGTTGLGVSESAHIQEGKILVTNFTLSGARIKEFNLDGTSTGREIAAGPELVGSADNNHGGFWVSQYYLSTLVEYDYTTFTATGRTLDYSSKALISQCLYVLNGLIYVVDELRVIHVYNETTLAFVETISMTGTGGVTARPLGVTRMNNKWFFVEFETGIVFRYDDNFVYDGYKLDISSFTTANNNWTGLAAFNSKFYVVNYITATVYVIDAIVDGGTFIGMSEAKTDTDSGLPLYVRIL